MNKRKSNLPAENPPPPPPQAPEPTPIEREAFAMIMDDLFRMLSPEEKTLLRCRDEKLLIGLKDRERAAWEHCLKFNIIIHHEEHGREYWLPCALGAPIADPKPYDPERGRRMMTAGEDLNARTANLPKRGHPNLR